MEGSGRMVVTAVGINSQTGIIFTLLRETRRRESWWVQERRRNGSVPMDMRGLVN